MTVARRLQGALVAFVVLIAVAVAFQVHMVRSAAESGRTLAEISARLRVTSTDQLGRLTQMRDDAEKFLVTREPAYLDRAAASGRAFGDELLRLDSLALSRAERSALVRVTAEWRGLAPLATGLPRVAEKPVPAAKLAIERFQAELDRLADATLALGAASQAAMSDELHAVGGATRVAERVSLAAAVGALILMMVLSARLVRSVVGPLRQLADGTRQVAAGRFDHRLDIAGGDELAEVARDFNSMTERLGALDRLKRDFVATVSHDLKTPLSSMQETTAAVLDGVAGPLSDRQQQLLGLTLENSRRLSAMLSKLLDLSRLEAGIEPTHQVVDLKRVVINAVDRMGWRASAPGPRVLVVDAVGDWFVRGDPQALGQVIDNLLENALKFSPAGATVTIRGEATGRGVTVTVEDEGPGIPDAERERVFERFYQTAAGRAVPGRGVGLGLAICRQIVGAHGGRIWVSSNHPRGSVFSVTLPAAGVAAAPVGVAA